VRTGPAPKQPQHHFVDLYWVFGRNACIACDAEGKSTQITWQFALCAECEGTHGKDRTTWPEWLLWLVQDVQKHRNRYSRNYVEDREYIDDPYDDDE